MKKIDLKKKLFDRGIDAIGRLTGTVTQLYKCPICLNEFAEDALYEDVLTLEHVPPESIGGKGICLTCKQCNSTSGSKIDSEISNRAIHNNCFNAICLESGKYEGRSKLAIGDEEINVQLNVDASTISIRPIKESNNPVSLDSLETYLKDTVKNGTWDSATFQITPRTGYHLWRSKVGDLKSAYLVCFAKLGYSYILNERLAAVRDQILNYEEKLIDYFWIKTKEDRERQYELFSLTKPFSSLGVRMRDVIIIMPWFDSPSSIYCPPAGDDEPGQKVDLLGKLMIWPKTFEAKLDFLE